MELFFEFLFDLIFSIGTPVAIISISSLAISAAAGYLKLEITPFRITWLSVFLLLILANKFSLFGEFSILHPIDSIGFAINQIKLIVAYYLIALLVIGRKWWNSAGKILSVLFGIFSIIFLIFPILSPVFSVFSLTLTVCLTLLEGVAKLNLLTYERIFKYKTKNELNNR